MASVNLGRVGLVLQGDWNSTTQYVPLDVVSYDGNSWVARQTNTNITPNTTNNAFWQLISNNADLVSTVQGYKNDAASSATAAAASAAAAASSAVEGSDALANEAATFSDSTAYTAGQYVIYDNGTHKFLYRFTADHAAGSWTGTDAVQVTLGADVDNLKSAIDEQDIVVSTFKKFNLVTGITLTNKKYWDSQTSTAVLSDVSSGYSASNAIPATAGKKYRAIVYTGSSGKQHAVLCVDSNYEILSSYKDTSSANHTYDFTAPANTAYILLTKGTTSTSNTYKCELYEVEYVTYPMLQEEIDEKANAYTLLKNKNVAIIGDSISTNGTDGDYPNVPEIKIENEDVGVQLSAYLTYYDYTAELSLGGHAFTLDEVGTEVTFTPVAEDVGKVIGLANNYNPASRNVWWEECMNEFGFTPIPVCWSGSSYSSHDTARRYWTSYAWHDAQIRKCGIRTPGTMTRTAPDVIILYRGTNDFSHEEYDILTSNYPGGLNWQYPTDDTVTGGKGFKQAIVLTIKKLRATYPNAFIFLCTLNVFKRINCETFPVNNGLNTLQEYNDAIREVANFMGIPVIEFDKDGITFENCYTGGYVTDSSTNPTHPSDKGHKVMGLKAIADIKAKYSPTTGID